MSIVHFHFVVFLVIAQTCPEQLHVHARQSASPNRTEPKNRSLGGKAPNPIDQRARALNIHGINAYSEGKTAKAAAYFEEAAALFRKTSNEFSFFRTLLNLSHTYEDLGFFADAEIILKSCRDHYLKNPDNAQYVDVLQSLGNVASFSGDHRKAEKYYREAMNRIGEVDARDRRDKGYAYWLLGCNYLEVRQGKKARKAFERAASLDETLKTKIRNQEGFLLLAEAKNNEAERVIRSRLKELNAAKTKGSEYASLHMGLALVLAKKKEFAHAKRSMMECVAVTQEEYAAGHPIVAQAFETLSNVIMQEGNPMEATRIMAKAREIQRLSRQRHRKAELDKIFGK